MLLNRCQRDYENKNMKRWACFLTSIVYMVGSDHDIDVCVQDVVNLYYDLTNHGLLQWDCTVTNKLATANAVCDYFKVPHYKRYWTGGKKESGAIEEIEPLNYPGTQHFRFVKKDGTYFDSMELLVGRIVSYRYFV